MCVSSKYRQNHMELKLTFNIYIFKFNTLFFMFYHPPNTSDRNPHEVQVISLQLCSLLILK